MTTLLLLRHGESEWNALGRWQGQADPPLTERGRRQAREAAALLERPARVVSSDLRRAAETADILAAAHGLEVEDRVVALRERHAGPWQGCTHAEIEAGWPGMLASAERPAGFEVDADILARVLPALEALASPTEPAAPGNDVVVVVTHGGVLRSLERAHGIDGSRIPNLGGRRWEHTAAGLVAGSAVLLVPPEDVTRPEET